MYIKQIHELEHGILSVGVGPPNHVALGVLGRWDGTRINALKPAACLCAQRALLEPLGLNPPVLMHGFLSVGGGGGIRTHGGSPLDGFQDHCLQPLSHPSAE